VDINNACARTTWQTLSNLAVGDLSAPQSGVDSGGSFTSSVGSWFLTCLGSCPFCRSGEMQASRVLASAGLGLWKQSQSSRGSDGTCPDEVHRCIHIINSHHSLIALCSLSIATSLCSLFDCTSYVAIALQSRFTIRRPEGRLLRP